MEQLKLHHVDLNLLVAFDILMQEKNVTRAAQRMFVSQSAMSHTLRRLRELFDDQILVPGLRGMRPTPYAQQLINPVREALALLERTIQPQMPFDPATSDHCFFMGSTDYVEYVILPPLIKHLARVAPKVRIRLKRYLFEKVEEHLESGDLDVVIRAKQSSSSRLQSIILLEETPVILARIQHPQVNLAISPEQYYALPHVVIDSFEMSDSWQDFQVKLKTQRNVALRSPNFLSAPLILAESDMIATLPLKIAQIFIRGGRLKILPHPIAVPPFEVELTWHRLQDNEPAQGWFREQVLQVAAQLREQGSGIDTPTS